MLSIIPFFNAYWKMSVVFLRQPATFSTKYRGNAYTQAIDCNELRAHHINMQFSNLHFGHSLFEPHIMTFQGQTLFWPSMLPKAPHIQSKSCSYHAGNTEKLSSHFQPEIQDCPWQVNCSLIEVQLTPRNTFSYEGP